MQLFTSKNKARCKKPRYISFFMTSYTWQDFASFMGQKVRRKESNFETEIWIIYGCNDKQVFMMLDEDNSYRLQRFFSTMLEDFIFENGKPFGK